MAEIPKHQQPELSAMSRAAELQATIYQSRNPTRRWLHQSRRAYVCRLLRRYGKGSVNALEVGPGSGIYLPTLCDLATRVTAIDIDHDHLTAARSLQQQFTNLDVHHGDILKISTREQFDLILCTEVIEHIEDSETVLKALNDLLTSHGVLILSTPQRYSTLELCAKIAFLPGIIQLLRLVYGEAIEPLGHINLLTAKQFDQQIKRAGFKIVEKNHSGFYLPVVAEFFGKSGQRILRSLDGSIRFGMLSRLSFMLWTQYRVVKKI